MSHAKLRKWLIIPNWPRMKTNFVCPEDEWPDDDYERIYRINPKLMISCVIYAIAAMIQKLV